MATVKITKEIAAMLAIGGLPAFVGLAVVMPLLKNATWHLCRILIA